MRQRGARAARWTAAAVLVAGTTSAGLVLPAGPASAETLLLPGTLTTAVQSESSVSVPVPPGTTPSAITAVMTQDEVSPGGSVVFTVNGRVALVEPSALYRKVTIPVTPADVIADGTIGLTFATVAAATEGASCTPSAGDAALRKVALEYTGVEAAPTDVGSFFPATSTGITVQIPADANDATITAGLTAVAALATRYDDDTPISLTPKAFPATAPVATERRVVITPSDTDGVSATVASTDGVPTLTLTGRGDDLVNGARALASSAIGQLSGTVVNDPSVETKPRSKDTERTLQSLGVDGLTVTGYGSVSNQFELRQDSFGQPVDGMDLHLEGSHTAFAEGSGARLDVRANGTLVGSTDLSSGSTFSVDARVPANRLRSVNDITVTLTSTAPDGSTCTPAGVPAAEVDLDPGASTVTVSPGQVPNQGFQLFPQVLEGTLPIALKTGEGGKPTSAINAADLVVALQRAADGPLQVQLVTPPTFLADDRPGLFLGAVQSDSEALGAPLVLSEERYIDQQDQTVKVSSPDPYAALESIDREGRLVLMLGSWSPGDGASKGALARKVVEYVRAQGWSVLDGDLVLADEANPALDATSDALRQQAPAPEEEKSYAPWFIAVIAVLLLLLLLQVVVAVRRDRKVAKGADDGPGGPAYVEDPDHEVDQLGDVDDLDVLEDVDERADGPTTPAKATPPVTTPPVTQEATPPAAKKTTPPGKKTTPPAKKTPGQQNRPTGGSSGKKPPGPRKPGSRG